MSRFMKGLSIVAILALIAIPAFAEVQNVKVSGDIDSKVIQRNQYDFANGNSNNPSSTSYKDKDTWFMTTTRVQIDADLTDNVATCVRLLNERDWDTEADATNDIDIDVAYVTLKEFLYSPLTLKIGRQNLRFGSGLVVGDPDTNDTAVANAIYADDLSVRKAFDAIRATFDYSPLVLDVLMAKIDANSIGVGSTTKGPNDDVDLYGINAAYKLDKMNSEVEGYLFSKIDKSSASLKNKVYTYGIRGSAEPISKLVLDGEVAYQTGDYSDTTINKNIDRRAWAADIGANYSLDMKFSPKIGARYSYRSGQKTPGTDADVDATASTSKYKAWDTMFEDQTHGIIANKIFDGNNDGVDSNSHIINVNASIVPLQDLTLSIDYYHYRLAEKFYSTGVSGAASDNRSMNGITYEMKNKSDLGDEIDVALTYDYTEDVKLGLTAGYFLPGSAFQKSNDNAASTIMADVSVSF